MFSQDATSLSACRLPRENKVRSTYLLVLHVHHARFYLVCELEDYMFNYPAALFRWYAVRNRRL